MESKNLAELIAKTLSDKKAYDILVIDVKEKTSLADYFVIASGKSSTQVGALCDHAVEAAEKAGAEVRRKEGLEDCRWAVVDFGDVILHVFNDDTRLFYHLERLWATDENTEKIED
ncbi:MAG TPA: ribosome silencing factor [Clostridiales bacterium]|nr:ribosome silencing factor [Clostridiales bacterium]